MAAWGTIEAEDTVMEVNGKNVTVYTIEGVAGDMFKVVVRYSGSPVNFNVNQTAYRLDPLAAKMDFHVMNWKYAAENTKLALEGRFKSKAKFHDRRPDNDVPEIYCEEGGVASF